MYNNASVIREGRKSLLSTLTIPVHAQIDMVTKKSSVVHISLEDEKGGLFLP